MSANGSGTGAGGWAKLREAVSSTGSVFTLTPSFTELYRTHIRGNSAVRTAPRLSTSSARIFQAMFEQDDTLLESSRQRESSRTNKLGSRLVQIIPENAFKHDQDELKRMTAKEGLDPELQVNSYTSVSLTDWLFSRGILLVHWITWTVSATKKTPSLSGNRFTTAPLCLPQQIAAVEEWE